MQDGQDGLFRAVRSKFVTLPEEELILVVRKHWVTFILPMAAALILGVLTFAVFAFLYKLLPSYAFLLISALALILIFTTTLTLRAFVDWYFHLYMVTNRKIIEVCYHPLSSREVNEVLLDQVKCTEIDAKINGAVNEFLDMGDVIITFDRPTHQEEFVFVDIQDPKSIETQLENTLCYTTTLSNNYLTSQDGEGAWYAKDRRDAKKWRYVERIPPARAPGAI